MDRPSSAGKRSSLRPGRVSEGQGGSREKEAGCVFLGCLWKCGIAHNSVLFNGQAQPEAQATPRKKTQELDSLKGAEGTIANCLVFPAPSSRTPLTLCPGCGGASALARAGRSLQRDPHTSSGGDGRPVLAVSVQSESHRWLAARP